MFKIIKIIVLSFLFVSASHAALYENWNGGEPSDPDSIWVASEDCVEIYASNGKWNDKGCDSQRHYSCYDGAAWAITREEGRLGGINTGSADASCKELGARFYFAAPFNNYESERLSIAIGDAGLDSAWINANDKDNEKTLVTNASWGSAVMPPYITRWSGEDSSFFDEPDNGGVKGNQDCTVMDDKGFWHDTECDAGPYRFLCADPAQDWYLSSTSSDNLDLYAGEHACRDSNVSHSFKAPVSDPEYDRTLADVLGSITAGESIWVNVNDQLDEGNFQENENRYFWNANEPNGNLNGTEECVVNTSNSAESGWNDVTCSDDGVFRAYACFQHATQSWVASTVTSTAFDLSQGIAACQAIDSGSHKYTFWAPVTPSQNAAALQNIWLNIKYSSSLSKWVVNQDAAEWGKTVVWDKDEDGFNTNPRTISEPNNGVFPSYEVKIPNLPENPNSEHCASQQPDGYWFDTSCSFALPVACFDSSPATEKPWKLAQAQVNKGLYTGEQACQSLNTTHSYHYLAPATRQQQVELANLAGLSAVWINASDRITEKNWRYNDFLTFWAGSDTGIEQPVSDESLDCAIANGSNNSLWEVEGCSVSHQALCTDGTSWSLSATSVNLSNSIVSGQNACGSSLIFAAPKNLAEQAAVKALIIGKDVWVNAFDTEVEGDWKINQRRFWDSSEPNVANSASEDCALMKEGNGLWESDECHSVTSYPYLCFDLKNAHWKVSTINGNLENFPEGQNACEAMNTYTEEYEFAAPAYEWENAAAKAAATLAGASSVWINANDRIEEGNWVFNQFLYWSSSALDGNADTNDCLTMTNLGYWQDTSCDSVGVTKVACYSGDGWYLASTDSDLSNFSDGQRACDAIGEGYLFFAPTTNEHNRDLRALISDETVWINGIDIAEEGKWVLNSAGLPTPNWASTEPGGADVENCAYVNQQGLWFDDACSGSSAARPVVCRDTSSGVLSISLLDTTLNSDNHFDNAHGLCGSDKSFTAPITFNENEALVKLMIQTSHPAVWVNVSDALFETRWALNIAATANYGLSGDTGSNACGSLNNVGSVTAADCSLLKVVACSDGQEWRVSNTKAALGNASNNGKLIRNAFAICQQEFSGDFTFAVPESNDELGKWQLAQALALRGASDAWLNMADWFVADTFSYNMPYQNISISAAANTGCAYVDGSDSGWLVVEECDTKAAHFACYDGSNWKVAPANGTIDQPSTPQLSVDTWDQSYGDLRCKEFFGEGYNFTAPITPKEDAKLQLLVSRLDNDNKDTWINYYANRLWTLNGQQWFGDRINTKVVDGINLDQGRTTEDCGLISKTAGKLYLTDDVCSDQQRALCFNGTDWKRTTAAVQWNQASAQCGIEFDEAHMFAIPRDGLERSLVDSILVNSDAVWVNYSDLAVEDKWRANLPIRQWWSINEPSNMGNRDCAVIDGATSTWRADYCDQVFYQYTCKNGTQWKVVGTDGSDAINSPAGIWPQGFSACRKLSAATSQDWSFEFPEDYFANLNIATTISASTPLDNDFDNADLQDQLATRAAWINLTDQYREKNWQRGRQFSDWAAAFDFDDNQDCAYVDTETTKLENGDAVKGSWMPDLCHASDQSRSFACSNGKNWKVTTTSSSDWKDGFAACQTLGSEWVYSAPNTSFDNERLKAAIGKDTAWINLQDVSTDGDWAANLVLPNLPPVIKFSASTSSINVNPVDENISGLILELIIIDPENTSIQNVTVLDVNALAENIVITTALPCTSPCTLQATYKSPTLTNISKEMKFKVTANDGANKQTFTYLSINVLPPIVAWFDFNDVKNPQRDITGNGNNANDDPELPYDFPEVKSGALNMVMGTETMTVPMLKTKAGAELSNSYAVALRVRIDEDDASNNQEFSIKLGSNTAKCLDLPGSGTAALTNGANATVYDCDAGLDQLWYHDTVTGFIHSVANDEYCLAHPDGGPVVDRNVAAWLCSGVNQGWDITGGLITPASNSGFALQVTGTANGNNINLGSNVGGATQTFVTATKYGRGILQRGESDAESQPGLRLQDSANYLEYAATSVDSGTQLTATTAEVADGQWLNLVLNIDSSADSMTLYIDGIAQPSTPLPGGAVVNTKALVLGAIASSYRGFVGLIDDVQVFSRPLSPAEISEVFPIPPVGVAQFEMSEINLSEPQVSNANLNYPVIIRRTDGSNGSLRATISTENMTATSPADYAALVNQTVTWAAGDAVLRPSPEYGLEPLLSTANGELINSIELSRDQVVFAAFDMTVPANPVGIVWEQGDINNGALVAFNDSNELIIRAGGDATSAARLLITAADVTTKLVGKTGSLLVEIDPLTNTLNAWFMDGGLIGTTEVISLGTDTATGSFPNGTWSNGAQGRLGDLSEIKARYIRDRLNGSNQNTSGHWVEVEAYAASDLGTNIAFGKTVSAYDSEGVTVTPVTGSLTQVVDGIITSDPYVDLGIGERIVQVDLGAVTSLAKINIRHYYSDNRSYNATKLEVSEDGSKWIPVFDSAVSGTYQENSAGRTFNRMVNEANITTSAFSTVTMARFYNQAAPSPLQRSVEGGKIITVNISNEDGFDREPTERFKLSVTATEKDIGAGWVDHAEGMQGNNSQAEILLLDYTKNPAGIFQFNVSAMECSEPHAGDNEGTMDLANSTGRLYRSCEVQVQRRTGVVGDVQISYGIAGGSVSFTDQPEHSGDDATDMVLDQHLTGGDGVLSFPQGVSVRSIGFRVLADKPSVYEDNEKFRIALFNPLNNTPEGQRPWMGDPISVEVTLTDYAVGEIAMTSSNASLPEPLYAADGDFEIRTVSVSRKNGTNGIAIANVTASPGTATSADYEMVDKDGNPQNPVTLSWGDRESSSLPVYIKIFADKYQENLNAAQTTDSAAACYDGNSDGKADNNDRNCFTPESFTLTVTQNGGVTPVDADRATTEVYLKDITAPTNVIMNASLADKEIVPERVGLAAIVDVDSDGMYDEEKEGSSVPDNSMTVTVTRDNRYAEHAFYIDFMGVTESTMIAATIGDDTGTRIVHDAVIDPATASSTSSFEFSIDLVTPGSNSQRRYMLVLPQDSSAPDTAQSVTLTVDILDNYRGELADRRVDVQLSAASDRDSSVIVYTGYPGANSLLRGFGISDVNLDPIFTREVDDITLAFPIRNGGSMAVKYDLVFDNDPEPTNNSPIVSSANYSVKALDQDWIDVIYSVNDGVQTPQDSTGEYPAWSFSDITTQWNYLQAFNVGTGAPYLSFIRNLAITATDSDGIPVSTNITNTRVEPRWMRIVGFNDCVRETGGDVKDDNCTNDGASQWLAVPDKDVANAYRLINGWEGKCMTASSAANDADIRVATCTDNNALQRWQFDGAGSTIRLRQDDDDYKLCRILASGGDLRIRTGGCTQGANWSEWNDGNYVPR